MSTSLKSMEPCTQRVLKIELWRTRESSECFGSMIDLVLRFEVPSLDREGI